MPLRAFGEHPMGSDLKVGLHYVGEDSRHGIVCRLTLDLSRRKTAKRFFGRLERLVRGRVYLCDLGDSKWIFRGVCNAMAHRAKTNQII